MLSAARAMTLPNFVLHHITENPTLLLHASSSALNMTATERVDSNGARGVYDELHTHAWFVVVSMTFATAVVARCSSGGVDSDEEY